MGNSFTCQRASACGQCPWGQECFSCVYDSEAGSHSPDTVCHASASSVSLQILLPIFVLVLLLMIAYVAGRWKRLQRLRKEQEGYSVDLARIEGIYAANAISYSFSDDILPYIMPTDIRSCLLYYPTASKFTCTTGFIFLLLSAFFIPLGLFTMQSGYNDYAVKNTHHFASAGLILLVLGSLICIVFAIVNHCSRQARQERNNEREQRVLRAAAEAGVPIISASTVIPISSAETMSQQQPQMIGQPQYQYNAQYAPQYTPQYTAQYAPQCQYVSPQQLPMSQQQVPEGYGFAAAMNPYAQPPVVAQAPTAPLVSSSSASHTNYVPLH